MAETELLPCPKPCPFCDDVIHLRLSTAGRGQSYMNCDVCGADGPLGDTPDLAIAAWNRRALPLPDPAEGSSGAGAPPFDKGQTEPAASNDLAFGRALLMIDQLMRGERNVADAAKFLHQHNFKRHCR